MNRPGYIKSLLAVAFLVLGLLPVRAQEVLPTVSQEDVALRTARDSASKPLPEVFKPSVGYSFSAGAAFSKWGSASFIEPRVQYQVTPRFQVFSSLAMIQHWNTPTLTVPTGEGSSTTVMTGAPSRQYLLHVGGSYAMSEKLLLSGSVWKDLSSAPTMNRWRNSPYGYGQLPQQGFHFQAQYQVTPNVTVSGAIRYSNGGSSYWGGPGYYSGYPAGGFYNPF
ncbi:hypothetical protein [Rufibacter ruber]|uniref:hypothetical protein n=1 Tax=Rufibacter ruber TaxID=1783499 RepID=UPI000A64974D|nr:hypothetical protein [Rufibacter ruber]